LKLVIFTRNMFTMFNKEDVKTLIKLLKKEINKLLEDNNSKLLKLVPNELLKLLKIRAEKDCKVDSKPLNKTKIDLLIIE